MITLFKREHIPRHDDQPYLERLIVFRCSWFGILLHKFVGSDDECLHSHPWNFVTFLLKGGYYEWTYIPIDVLTQIRSWQQSGQASRFCSEFSMYWEKAPDGRWLWRNWCSPGSALYRPADWTHRVEFDPKHPAITLVIHGPKICDWGFFTKLGWLLWSKYSYKDHCS